MNTGAASMLSGFLQGFAGTYVPQMQKRDDEKRKNAHDIAQEIWKRSMDDPTWETTPGQKKILEEAYGVPGAKALLEYHDKFKSSPFAQMFTQPAGESALGISGVGGGGTPLAPEVMNQLAGGGQREWNPQALSDPKNLVPLAMQNPALARTLAVLGKTQQSGLTAEQFSQLQPSTMAPGTSARFGGMTKTAIKPDVFDTPAGSTRAPVGTSPTAPATTDTGGPPNESVGDRALRKKRDSALTTKKAEIEMGVLDKPFDAKAADTYILPDGEPAKPGQTLRQATAAGAVQLEPVAGRARKNVLGKVTFLADMKLGLQLFPDDDWRAAAKRGKTYHLTQNTNPLVAKLLLANANVLALIRSDVMGEKAGNALRKEVVEGAKGSMVGAGATVPFLGVKVPLVETRTGALEKYKFWLAFFHQALTAGGAPLPAQYQWIESDAKTLGVLDDPALSQPIYDPASPAYRSTQLAPPSAPDANAPASTTGTMPLLGGKYSFTPHTAAQP